MVFNRGESRLLGQAEKWPFHCVALVANRNVSKVCSEQVGLVFAPGREPFGHALYPG
jgi:hypothetical protein